jgi:thioredoxin 1
MDHDPTDSGREPTRDEVDRMPGPVVLEFGASWCPICQAAAPDIAFELKRHPEFRHVKVEDGRGRPLGRSFRVKLWPTLVFLRDGRVVAQATRPDSDELHGAFESLASSAPEFQSESP